MARVSRTTSENYKKTLENSRGIASHKYDVGEMFELNIQKQAKTPDLSGVEFGLPSWVFFRDFTGYQPSIKEEDMAGEYLYDVHITCEENLVEFYKKMALEGALTDELTKTLLTADSGITLEEIQAFAGIVPNEGLLASFNAKYAAVKKKFIDERTTILIDHGAMISISERVRLDKEAPQQLQQGTGYVAGSIPPKAEAKELHEKYASLYYFCKEVALNQFRTQFPGLDETTETAKSALRDYYSGHLPITGMPQDEGVCYAIETKVNKENTPVTAVKNRLVAYDLRRGTSRLEKIESVINDELDVDIEFDYIPLRVFYTVGKDKKEAGLNKSFKKRIENRPLCLEYKDVYTNFNRTLYENCISAVKKWDNFNESKADSIIKDWFKENVEFIKKLPIETLTRYESTIKTFGEDLGILETFTIQTEVPPAQQQQAATVQQQQAAPAQQQMQQAPTMQEQQNWTPNPVQQPAPAPAPAQAQAQAQAHPIQQQAATVQQQMQQAQPVANQLFGAPFGQQQQANGVFFNQGQALDYDVVQQQQQQAPAPAAPVFN